MINRLSVKFNDRETERSFRNIYLEKDSSQGMLAVFLCLIPVLLFIGSDYLLFGLGVKFFYILSIRASMLAGLLGMIVFLWISRNFPLNDAVTFIFWLIMTAGTFYVYSTRPPGYTHYPVFDVIAILSIYLVLPNRFILQVLPALLYTVIDVVFIFNSNMGTDMVIIVRILLSLLFANMVGIFLSWRVQYLRRLEYVAFKKERELTVALDDALKNVKTLGGLLPICSKCHKIRNDEGYWKSIDIYIMEHSDAQFTHSLCNDCMEKLYSGEKWFKNDSGEK